jgi:F-type H+-transporting ATPase subunit a
MKSPLEQFDSIKLYTLFFGSYEFSFFHIMLPIIILNLLIIIHICFFKNKYKLIPDVWQYLFELLYIFVFNILKNHVGPKGYLYFPFIFIIFNFILWLNLCGLLPFGIALTSYVVLILFLTITICNSIFVIGLLTQNLSFLKIFIPKSPFLLLIILIPIEIFSYFIRMFSLGIRLVANILAGHTLVYILANFISKLILIKVWFFFLIVSILLMIIVLEFGIALLQAYVFTTLICIYLSDSVNEKKH